MAALAIAPSAFAATTTQVVHLPGKAYAFGLNAATERPAERSLQVANANGKLFFFVTDGNAEQLWTSNGTKDGTKRAPGSPTYVYHAYSPLEPKVLDSKVYFSAEQSGSGSKGRELWVSDGKQNGTKLVVDIQPGPGSSNPTDLTVAGPTGQKQLYFAAYNDTNGEELWKSNGDTTTIVTDINNPPESRSSNPQRLTAAGSKLYFTAYDGWTALWASEGSGPSTRKVTNADASLSALNELGALGSKVFFSASDGISAGRHNSEPWVLDNSSFGSRLVADINPGPAPSNPKNFTAVGTDKLFFVADNGTVGAELWVTNGGSTRLLKNIPSVNSNSSNPSDLTPVGSKLYFTPRNAPGQQLWKTDGTPAGTKLVKKTCGTCGPTYMGGITPMGSKVYFSATDGTNGLEPWVSDISTGATRTLKNIGPDGTGSNPYNFKVVGGNTLYFFTHSPSTGDALWSTVP